MTPNVRDILIETRKRIHAATAETVTLPNTNVLGVIDNLIAADAARSTGQPASEIVINLNADADECEHVEEIRELRKRLSELEAWRRKDDELIAGLQRQIELERRNDDQEPSSS